VNIFIYVTLILPKYHIKNGNRVFGFSVKRTWTNISLAICVPIAGGCPEDAINIITISIFKEVEIAHSYYNLVC
jgi:hypothetical protein